MEAIRWFVMSAAVAVLVNSGAPASEPDPFSRAEALCDQQGGIFTVEPESYSCDGVAVTLRAVDRARSVCESAFNGSLFSFTQSYNCVIS